MNIFTIEKCKNEDKLTKISKICQELLKRFNENNEYENKVQILAKEVINNIQNNKYHEKEWNQLLDYLDENIVSYSEFQERLSELLDILNPLYPGIERGRGSWYTDFEIADFEHCDSAQVKDIDFTIDETEKTKHERFWEVVVEDSPIREDEDKEDFSTFYKKDYFLEKYKNKETYVKEQISFATYALLYKGQWIEPGQMGWFGCSSANKEGYDQYRQKFEEIINNLNPEDYISIIDCHI